MRLIDSCITQLEAQAPSWTRNKSKKKKSPIYLAPPPRRGPVTTALGIRTERVLLEPVLQRGTSLIRNTLLLATYSRTIPRVLWWS